MQEPCRPFSSQVSMCSTLHRSTAQSSVVAHEYARSCRAACRGQQPVVIHPCPEGKPVRKPDWEPERSFLLLIAALLL